MSDDQTKPHFDDGELRDPLNAPVSFANDVAGVGFLNGVVNLTLATARFTPDHGAVRADRIVAARLRFDLYCAQQLVDLLGKIIEQNTKGPAQPAPKAMN